MQTICKYPFEVRDTFSLTLPRGSRILHVDLQGDQPCLWALVDTERPPESRRFRIFATGQPLKWDTSDILMHRATFFQEEFVRHLFELVPDDE